MTTTVFVNKGVNRPDGEGWEPWQEGLAAPSADQVVEVVYSSGKRSAPFAWCPSLLQVFDRVAWYRIRQDLGVIVVDAAPGPDATAVLEVGRWQGMTIHEQREANQHVTEVLYPGDRVRCKRCNARCGKDEALPDVCVPTQQWVDEKRDAHMRATRPADIRAAANAPWPSGSKLTPEEVAELRQAGKEPLRLNTVAEAIGYVRKTGKPLDDAALARTWLTREQLAELYPRPDEESKRLRDMVDQVAELDAENARLRRDVAELAASAKTWEQRTLRLEDRVCALLDEIDRLQGKSRSAGNVIRIEPFPDVEPRSDSWPPPSHKPRMLP